jgi:hypothetical protein
MSEQPKGESEGRKENAATADYPGVSEVTPQDYPRARSDEAVERTGRTEEVVGEDRSFGNATGNPEPPQGAGDGSVPASTNEGRTGPQGDPAEGRR